MTLTQDAPTTTAIFTPGKLFIGGEWREASDGGRTDDHQPCDRREAHRRREGHHSRRRCGGRRRTRRLRLRRLVGPAPSRARAFLQRADDLMRERTEELAQAESANVGKPITFAAIRRREHAAEQYEYYASLGHHLDGSVRESAANAHAYISGSRSASSRRSRRSTSR